jgi:hypothetical protein
MLIGSTTLLLNARIFACEEPIKPKILNLAESEQLLEDVQYLLSDKETIDYNDPRLNEILNKYDYNLFKIYKAFIEFDKSDKTQTDIDKAKAVLLNLFHKIKQHFHWSDNCSDEKNITNSFLDLISGGFLTDNLAHLFPGERKKNWDNGYKYIKIPLWLALKYPEVINIDGVYTLTVNAKNSIKNLKEFNDFISSFSNIHHGYLSPFTGDQEINSYIITKHFIDIISFNPERYIKFDSKIGVCAGQSFRERMLYGEKRSYLRVGNRPKYERF